MGCRQAAFDFFVRRPNLSADLNRNLWKSLAQLENTRGLFRFKDLEDLESQYAELPKDAEIGKANSRLLVLVLER